MRPFYRPYKMKLREFVWLHVVVASLLAFAFSVHFVKWPVYWPLRVKGLKYWELSISNLLVYVFQISTYLEVFRDATATLKIVD